MTHWTKFQRAHEHLGEVEAIIDRFLDMEPYRIVSEYDPKPPYRVNQQVIFRTWFHAPAPIPEALPRIIGDCLTNLRASLDHLVYAIALQHTGAHRLDQTFIQFPIYDAPERFAAWRGKVVKPNLLPVDVLEYVERKQPYQGFDPNKSSAELHFAENPLWLLNALVNVDKHRALNPVTQIRVAGALTRVGEGFTLSGRVGPQVAMMSTSPFKHGDPMRTILLTVRDPAKAEVQIEAKPPADVAFGNEWPGTGMGVRFALYVIRDHIRDVIFAEMEDAFLR